MATDAEIAAQVQTVRTLRALLERKTDQLALARTREKELIVEQAKARTDLEVARKTLRAMVENA
jgi:hypothetical protein